MSAATPSPIIAQARKDWQKAAEAAAAQRKAILAAKKFRALDQWPQAIRDAREGVGAIQGQSPMPPRPVFTVDRLSQPVRAISNTIKNADFGFDVMPNGQGADKETAEIIKGYLRRVQNQARCESPIEWAADGAVEGGLGWFRLKTRYVHESWDGDPKDPEAYDQELVLERIPNSLSVYDDPAANKPTRSDSLFRFIVEDMDRDAFKVRFPHADMRGLEEFQSEGDMSAWVSKDTIRVAEYWRVTFEEREITDGQQTRKVRKPIVKGSLINAVQELEPFKWVGSRIPSVPVLGEELNVDGKPVLRGIIALGMDAQRMVNYTYSAAVEIFALEPRKAPMVPAQAIANYKAIWDTRNVYNYAYWPYDQYTESGQELRQPIFDNSEAPIQSAVMLMRASEEAIKASTSTGDASLGNTNPNERSGRALEALQSQSDLANSNYPDNVKRALIYAAEMAGEVIPKITRPGQIWHIMGLDDEPEQVIVGQPFMKGPDGIPVAAPPHVTKEMARAKDSLWKFYDPTAGKYAYTVTVGKATATRQQEGAKALGDLIPHLQPEQQAVVMPDYIKQLSFPGAQGIAERLESILPPQLKPQKEGEAPAVPPEVQAQMQQLQAELAEAQKPGQVEQIKQAGAKEIETLKLLAQREKMHADNETKIVIAEIAALAKELQDTRALFMQERARLGVEAQAGASREHEVGMAAMTQAHAAEQAAQGRDAAATEAEAGRGHEADLAQRAQDAAAEQAERAAAQRSQAGA